MKWWTEQISNLPVFISNVRHSVMPLSRANLLSLSLSSNIDINKLTTEQWKYNSVYAHSGIHNNSFLTGTILKKIFWISGLNSFQQAAMSSPFSIFIILSEICFCGLRQSMKSASFIFLWNFSNVIPSQETSCFPNQFHHDWSPLHD